jgi:uncharacterized membrane protein YcjF (UPF0283 family)
MWWIAAGVVVVAIVVLVAVLQVLAGHFRPLRRALRRLQWRSEEAQRLQQKMVGVQEQLVALQVEAEKAAGQAEALKQHRAGLHEAG